MPDYNFQTLSDREFEKLARDLLQKETGFTFESFKPGRDGGIDLRHISPKEDNGIIAQVKHRTRSNFNDLFSHLKNEELKKVKRLKPARYILATSTEFNPAQKEKILKLFHPFIQTPGDILGRDDINGLLTKHLDVEENHPKLWLSSIPVLRRIINNGTKGRSDFTAENIEKNISLYVANKKYADSLAILNSEGFLVIIGEPGIGKTVLGKMLIYQLLGHDYKLISVTEKISEAEDLWDPGTKQVFYFDDFLGANYFEIAQHHNSDSALINFISRVKADPTKRLILTTRTTVLNHAGQIYPRLETPIIDLARHEVQLGDYTKLDKAQILYNHLFFLGLGEEYKQVIKEDKNYWKIINHQNYNPRLIEFISDPLRLRGIKPSDYMKFILERLDNPSEIWRHPYLFQIDDYCRFLLQTLFSLGESSSEQELKRAFNARLDYEIKNNGFKRNTDEFALTIKHLLGGFLKSERRGNELRFDFFNPSITDFLLHLLTESNDEKWRILESAIFPSQLNKRFGIQIKGYVTFSNEEIPRLHKLVTDKEESLINPGGGAPEIDLIDFYYFAFPDELNNRDLVRLMEKIDFNIALPRQASTLLYSLEGLFGYDEVSKVIHNRWREIIDYLFSSYSDQDRLSSIRNLFELYNENYDDYFANENSRTIVENSLNNCWRDQFEDLETGSSPEVVSFNNPLEIENYLGNVYSDGTTFNERFGFKQLSIMDDIEFISPDEIFESIKEKSAEDNYETDYHKEAYYLEREAERNMDKEVNELFS